MRSTFMGLEASKRGLFVQQSALYTTGHNISNANTDGYTRQRVNMQATPGFPYPGLNSPQYPGHLGTGVEAGSIQRMRDEFTDRQYRQETGKLGYWDSTLKSINQMEDILNEPSDFGINQAFTEFWKAFQDLADSPTDSAARKVAVARAESLAEAFNYNYTQLETIQGNIGNEIHVSTTQINTILEKIALINDQVKTLEPNGYVTNDLYDARDLLIDELNEYIPVSIERVPSGALASDVAEGSLRIIYKNANGQEIALVNGNNYAKITAIGTENGTDTAINGSMPAKPFSKITITAGDNTPAPTQVGLMTRPTTPDGTITFGAAPDIVYSDFSPSRGKLVALIDSYGYNSTDANNNPVVKGIYPEMMKDLDFMAATFIEVFNKAHEVGYSLTTQGTPPTTITGQQFFDPAGTTAKTIKVSETIVKDPGLIAASNRPNEEGNGRWALELSKMQFTNITGSFSFGVGLVPSSPGAADTNGITITIPNSGTGLGGFTFQNYYQGMIGDLAVLGDKAITNQFNSQTQMITVSNARSSMNSVSLDEEMTNMITFQQAYNANARMITVVDETLDKIINGMGRVGL